MIAWTQMIYYVYLDDFLMPSTLYRVDIYGKAAIWDGMWQEKEFSTFGNVFEIDEKAARKAFPSEAFLPG